MVGYYNKGVPTTADLENNSNSKKYTVNDNSGKGLHISKPLCALMAIGAILLAILVGLVVFFLIPRADCSGGGGTPELESLTRNGEFGEEIDERLPRDLLPTHYRLRINPDFQTEQVQGSIEIQLTSTKSTNTIIFHINGLKVDPLSVKIRNYDSKNDTKLITIREQSEIEGQRYKISLEEALKENSNYLLYLQYSGQLNQHLQGFYRVGYYENNNKIVAASTQFSPTDARRAFPCFDEPIFKAQFSISIGRPFNMTSLSNMPLETSEQMLEKPNWYWDHYQTTPKMSTYLVAFMVTTLKTNQQQANSNLIKIWSQQSLLPQTQYSSQLAPKLLQFFEQYFQINFPLPKMDIVAVPEFGFSAMENWGLITFRESSLLFNESTTTTEDEKNIASVLGHELAHQWFGNLVTMKWWNDLWLKEGFSTYLQYLGLNNVKPEWNILEEFIAIETKKAFELDALQSSRPISFSVKNSQQIKQTFDAISYSKGACIIRMMNHFLGEQTFKQGLINFLNQYKYSNANRNDLFASLTIEAQKNNVLSKNDSVKTIMDSWTEQAGFPVLSAKMDKQRKVLKLSQKRFLYTTSNNQDNQDNNESPKWWIPVSLTTDKMADFKNTKPQVWLKSQTHTELPIDYNNWYLLNLNQTGYYIVNYDENNWRQLIDNLMNFPPLIRAQLISDSMDLARANLLDYDIPLKMIAKMAVQDNMIYFIPTTIAFDKLMYVSDMLANTAAYGLFEQYHNDIFRKTYDLVDLSDDPTNDYLSRRIRSAVLKWSCRSSDSACAYNARNMYRNWMVKQEIVPPNLRQIVYCTAIRDGIDQEWQFAYEEYLRTEIPAEKMVLLDALGCTKEKWLLSRYLDILIANGSSIRIQDADRVFDSIARNKVGTSIAFDFLRLKWNELQEHFGEGFSILSKMIKSLAKNMNTPFQLEEFRRFKDSVKGNLSTTAQAFDSAIQIVKGNAEWMANSYESVEKWLLAHKGNYYP